MTTPIRARRRGEPPPCGQKGCYYPESARELRWCMLQRYWRYDCHWTPEDGPLPEITPPPAPPEKPGPEDSAPESHPSEVAAETRTRQPAERTTQAQALEQAETDAERFVSSQNARIPQPGQPDPNRDRTAPPPELQVLPPLEITRLHQDRTAPPPEIQALPPLEVTPLHKS